jgi:hypothetical protein
MCVSSGLPLAQVASIGNLDAAKCLLKELGADVNEAIVDGGTPLRMAANEGNLAMVQCLVNNFGADVNEADLDGRTPLGFAAHNGDLAMVQCLVKELGADVDQADRNFGTPLIIAPVSKHAHIVKWLVKAGADLNSTLHQDSSHTAAGLSREFGASAAQTAYLEAKTHCSSQGCSGVGLLKCTGCRQARYCGEACQLSHWRAHKADCRRWSAELEASKGNTSE